MFGLMAVVAVTVADACTGMYAGRRTTTDGSVLLGRTVDFSPYHATMFQQLCERGTQTAFNGTPNRFRYVCVPKSTSLKMGRYAGSAVNEKGVVLTGTVTGATRTEAKTSDVFVPVDQGGVGEPNLPDYLIGNAATAREAVELLAASVHDYGHAGPEIYMVADTNEAWYVEVYTGHEWAAVRMPEDKVAVFGNQFNIRGFDTNDTLNVMYSPNLVKLAVDRDLAVWEDEAEGFINLYETYSPAHYDYANYRTYWGHHAWAPTDYPEGSYATDTAYPLFFAPEPGKKISLTDIFELMRTRYEGVNCPDENGDTSIRVIGTTKQQSCHVLQMRHDLPEDYRCTLWECLAQAEHSTFLPVCMAVQRIPDAYSRDQELPLAYDARRAADAFLRLDTLAELKRFVVDTHGVRQDVRAYYGAGVRANWRTQEDRLVGEWPDLLANWTAARRAEGRARATAEVNFQHVWSLAEAKRLHDELAWYWAEFNCDLRDGGGATDVPTRPFASSVPTNMEMGVAWTRWHRTEFEAYVEELAGPSSARSVPVSALVAESKRVFDEVEDAATLALAKTNLEGIVRGLCQEIMSPLGSQGNPWPSGESVSVWTNGTGQLVIEGTGPMDDYASSAELPWAVAFADITSVRVGQGVRLGENSLLGMPSGVAVNGLVPSTLVAAVGGTAAAGAISPAEFERIEVVDGKAYLGVSVCTNGDLAAESGNWGKAEIENAVIDNGSVILAVPAPADRGFMVLKSQGAAMAPK